MTSVTTTTTDLCHLYAVTTPLSMYSRIQISPSTEHRTVNEWALRDAATLRRRCKGVVYCICYWYYAHSTVENSRVPVKKIE